MTAFYSVVKINSLNLLVKPDGEQGWKTTASMHPLIYPCHHGRSDYSWWGRLVENAVGAYLMNHLTDLSHTVYYWRYRGLEVDFVVKTPKSLWGIEVKSGNARNPKGIREFLKYYPKARTLVIGNQGMGLEEFFRTDPRDLF